MIEHKSAITDHADRNNCIIDWGEGAKVIDRERNRNARGHVDPKGNSSHESRRGGYRPACQYNWRAGELAVPEFLIKYSK